MNIHEFFFASDISKARIQELVDWVNSLPLDKQEMVSELRSDAAEEARYFATEDC